MGLELTEKSRVESKYSSGVVPVWFTEKIHDPAPAAGKEKGTTVSLPLNAGAPHKAVMVVPPSVAVMVGRSLGAASKPTKEKVPEIKVVLVDVQAADAGALGDDCTARVAPKISATTPKVRAKGRRQRTSPARIELRPMATRSQSVEPVRAKQSTVCIVKNYKVRYERAQWSTAL
jgi:hypothetical protein